MDIPILSGGVYSAQPEFSDASYTLVEVPTLTEQPIPTACTANTTVDDKRNITGADAYTGHGNIPTATRTVPTVTDREVIGNATDASTILAAIKHSYYTRSADSEVF